MNILTVARIMVMEKRCDSLLKHSPAQIRSDPRLQRQLRSLAAYSGSGLWLKDYVADERGRLPKWLKRGVLSEDGLYNLLCDLNNPEEGP